MCGTGRNDSPPSPAHLGIPPVSGGELKGGWHNRYVQQANWTRELRAYLFKEAGLDQASRALEVGCGTGAILSEISTPATVHGLDIQFASLKEAKSNTPISLPLTCGDAFSLPYADESFEVVFCHFLLLWLPHPLDAIREMTRVTKAGGDIIAFAEPDYNHRVDKPAALEPLGKWQREALRRQGANPGIGENLAELFFEAGINIIEAGAISKEGSDPLSEEERELEWAILESDLAGQIADERLQKLNALDKAAWLNGKRVLYVPTHYIWGRTAVG